MSTPVHGIGPLRNSTPQMPRPPLSLSPKYKSYSTNLGAGVSSASQLEPPGWSTPGRLVVLPYRFRTIHSAVVLKQMNDKFTEPQHEAEHQCIPKCQK
jgi:hypothetical protein